MARYCPYHYIPCHSAAEETSMTERSPAQPLPAVSSPAQPSPAAAPAPPSAGGSSPAGSSPRAPRRTDPAEEAAILEAIGRWLEKEVRPQAMRLEHDDIYPHDMVETMKSMGLFGAVLDPQWGGLGLSASTYSKIVMKISTVWMSLTGIFNSHLMMAVLVEKFGTAEQK